MTYYILKTKGFAQSVDPKRVLFVLKRSSVPEEERSRIINLKCASIQKVKELNEFIDYLLTNTADSSHELKPYMIKQITWSEANSIFGIDYDTDSSESAN